MKLESSLIHHSVLQNTLRIDCFVTGAVALFQIVAAEWLAPWFGISSALLRYSGLGLLIFVGYVMYCLILRKFSRQHMDFIIGVNGLWGIACLMFIYNERSKLSPFGMTFVIIQVIAVSAFAALEYFGSRRLVRQESQA